MARLAISHGEDGPTDVHFKPFFTKGLRRRRERAGVGFAAIAPLAARGFAVSTRRMTRPPRLRIGFIGAGTNTRLRHLPGFKSIAGVELACVANRSEASSARVAAEFHIGRTAARWEDVVAADDVDAVCIGTWPCLHADATIAALKNGKHVLTEARMARNVGEAEAMLAAARARPDLVAQIVPAPMTLDLDETALAVIDGGKVGELREVCVTHTGGQCADSAAPHTWRLDHELSGVNMLTTGIYYEMARRWVREDPIRIFASGRVFTSCRRDSENTEVDIRIPESITILGTYVSGARFVGHFSGVETGTGRNEIRLNGSKGCLRADLAEGALYYSGPSQAEDKVEIPAASKRGWRVEEDFVASIRAGKPVELTDFVTGVRYMRFTEAAFRSQESGGVWMDVTIQAP